MNKESKILVLGARGLVGSALALGLQERGYTNLLTPGRKELDLMEQQATRDYFEQNKPEYVFMGAGTVGGIVANSTRPAEFIYDNMMMAANVVESSRRSKVTKLMLLGSTCIYPKYAPQPIAEKSLLAGPLEPTNEWYAVAKIGGIKLGQAYRKQYGMDIISVMPTNLYGPRDNFDPVSSHVLPGLIRKMHDAREKGAPEVTLWGTGKPRREFLYVEDLVDALIFLMLNYSEEEIINAGSGKDVTIAELAAQVANAVGFQGKLVYDSSYPDGTPLKMSDSTRLLALGWKPKVELAEGIQKSYQWFLENALEPAAGASKH